MDLNLYFNPVSLEKPHLNYLNDSESFVHSVSIHTPDTPISNLENYDVAIMGIEEDRNALVPGSATAPDAIRKNLFLLGYVNKKTKIIDLGNLKITSNISDSYFALRDVFTEITEKNLVLIVLGGSQDLATGITKAFENYSDIWSVTSLDSRLDLNSGKEILSSGNYLSHLLKHKNSKKLNFNNIGHQVYFTPNSLLDKFEKKGQSSSRLGNIRDNIASMEPILRDTDVMVVDLGVVKQSEAPGASSPSPNGLTGYEFCQLLRYAGASSKMKALLMSEFIPDRDINEQSSHLIAQAIWYFIDGLSLKKVENPHDKGCKKFIVSNSSSEQNMIFIKSNSTNRWWMEISGKEKNKNKNLLFSCTYEDYQMACINEIPDRWWRLMRKFG
ncbi:MAG: formimidoylglutamase [Bacteroidales bacterium]|nr:formimidoylglutamase [Bacteroidales bacterium]MCF8389207.1 formimidoylglutamase [Bacteroidales bacterium]